MKTAILIGLLAVACNAVPVPDSPDGIVPGLGTLPQTPVDEEISGGTDDLEGVDPTNPSGTLTSLEGNIGPPEPLPLEELEGIPKQGINGITEEVGGGQNGGLEDLENIGGGLGGLGGYGTGASALSGATARSFGNNGGSDAFGTGLAQSYGYNDYGGSDAFAASSANYGGSGYDDSRYYGDFVNSDADLSYVQDYKQTNNFADADAEAVADANSYEYNGGSDTFSRASARTNTNNFGGSGTYSQASAQSYANNNGGLGNVPACGIKPALSLLWTLYQLVNPVQGQGCPCAPGLF